MTTTTKTTKPCRICRGTGHTFLEHEDGSLSEQVCPYCKGRKDSTWVAERKDTREIKRLSVKAGICFYLVALIATNGLTFWNIGNTMANPDMIVLHIAVWLLFIVGCGWWYTHPEPSKKKAKAKRQHAPGFSDDKEAILGAIVVGGAVLKAEHTAHQKALNAKLDHIIDLQNGHQ